MMLHQIGKWLTGESMRLPIFKQHAITIHLNPACTREPPGLIKAVKALFHAAGGIDGWIPREELVDRVGRDDVRIAAQVVILQNIVPERKTVLHAEPVAPVIAGATELRRAGLRIKLAGVRLEAEIPAAEVDLLASELALYLRAFVVAAVMRSGGAIHPAVHAPAQAVHAELLVAGAEAGVEHFLRAIGRNEKDVRRGGDDDAFPPSQDAGGITQVADNDVALVVAPVVVRVLQPHDASSGLAIAIHAERVVRHLDDPQAALLIPIKRDRIEHHRLRRDELDVVTVAHMPLLRGFFGGEWLGVWCRRLACVL